jgi:hypothetical protein
MGGRTTAALAVAVLIAAVVAWIDVRNSPAPDSERGFLVPSDGEVAEEPREIKRLLSFSPADVSAIHLQRGAVDIRLTRDDKRWSNVSRPQAVEDFLHNLTQLAEILPLEVTAEQRRDYGLDPPNGVIELERRGQSPIVLHLGNHNPPSTGAYAQIGSDGPVVLTGALALWELDKAIRASTEGAPAAAAPTDRSAAIVEHNGKWESGYGETFFNIVGRVRNGDSAPLRWIQLRAELVDANGAAIGNAEGFNFAAEGLSNETLPAAIEEKLKVVQPAPIPPGGEDRFRLSVLKDDAPTLASYRLSVVAVGR